MLLQYGDFTRIGDIFKNGNVATWEITSKDKSESMLGYFVNRISANSTADIIRFSGLDEGFDYEMKNRTQYINIKNFGGLINALPIDIDTEDNKLYDIACGLIKLKSEKEEYTVGGDSLMYSGFKPVQPGFNPLTARVLFDNDSRMYYLKKKEG